MDEQAHGVPDEQPEGEHWIVREGEVLQREGAVETWRPDGAVDLTYSNPFDLEIERVWWDGRVVYAVEQGELDVDLDRITVAQEYQIVYDVELDGRGKPVREPERVPGQYNIYDSVPGMKGYSPLWQFNYVVVPRDYEPNLLRSEAGCLSSGYPIIKSTVVEN